MTYVKFPISFPMRAKRFVIRRQDAVTMYHDSGFFNDTDNLEAAALLAIGVAKPYLIGCQIMGIDFDFATWQISFCVTHPSFDPVEPGCIIPVEYVYDDPKPLVINGAT